MLNRKIVIPSYLSKEEVVDLLRQHVEPWRKDGSTFDFEGKISPSGEFRFWPPPVTNGYKTHYSTVIVRGNVAETENGSKIHIKVSLKPVVKFAYVASLLVLIIFFVFSFSGLLPVEIPWFVAAPFVVVLLFQYLGMNSEINKTIKNLAFIKTG